MSTPPTEGGLVSTFAQLEGQKYLTLQTFKRDGSPVETPIWFVGAGDRLYCRSYDETFKVKRFRRNPVGTVAPADFRGELRGKRVPVRIAVVPEREWAHLRSLFQRKYPIAYNWELRVLSHWRRFKHRRLRGRAWGNELFYEIVPREPDAAGKDDAFAAGAERA